MKNKIKQIIKNKHFLIGMILPWVLVAIFLQGAWEVKQYLEQRDNEIFQTAWENGYMEGQIDQEELIKNECFNISKNRELNELLKKYFKDCKLAKTMWAIAQAESSGKQFAVGQNDNGSLDGGWLQVNTIHKKPWETKEQFIARVHDLEENIKEARKVYDKQGLTAWVTYNNGKYLTYLE